MTREIVWKGNGNTNSSSRGAYVPILIVDHISVGTMASMDSWFTSPGNKTSSANYGVAKDGSIHQYVDIRRMAWANGIGAADIAASKTPVVHDHPGVNPNLYSVSIEHEGTDGDLTPEQFEASLWLHRYIQNEVLRIWGTRFELDPYHVIGHFMVNPVGKPFCPGPKFPWSRLYAELTKGEDYLMTPEDANKIINRWLADEYNLASDDDKDERHRLANELRKASGQPEE
jgi:N-acetylmuramoyl-L-alanine amidase